MTNTERKILKKMFPEAPKWILESNHCLEDAVKEMELRRKAFPATKPGGSK